MGNFNVGTKSFEAFKYSRMAMEAERIAKWCKGSQNDEGVIVNTPSGERLAEYGDYIIKNQEGEFEVFAKDIFESVFKSA